MSLRIPFVMATAFMLLGSGRALAADAVPAKTLVDRAVSQAHAQNKVVFIHFSASW